MVNLKNIDERISVITERNVFSSTISILSRILIAFIFIISGYGKITGYESTIAYMESMGVSGTLLPLVIIAELGGGIALIVGFQTRLAALGLAVFCITSAFIFHTEDDMNQQIHFMKNLAISGGLLSIFLNGSGKLSVDAKHINK